MNARHWQTMGFLAIVLAGTLVVPRAPPSPADAGVPAAIDAPPPPPLRFGMDAGAVDALRSANLRPDYAMIWVGIWLERSGWAGTDAQFERFQAAGVTPVVQFYYWGDDISATCLENGCWSGGHDGWKDRQGWQRLAAELAQHLDAHMKGRTAVIVLETEFNKNDAATYEPLDAYLADKARFFRGAYPASQVVLGFGNWARWAWATFDRAADASDLVGIQGLRASTRDDASAYGTLVPSLLDGVKALRAQFQKNVLITDFAVSSHGDGAWLEVQRAAVQALMDRRDEFRAAGVVGIVYRSLYDAAGADTNAYFGLAERSFGLAWAGNKTWKPAMDAWANGMRAERSLPVLAANSAIAQRDVAPSG